MATLKIQRTSEFNNKMRNIKIFVDKRQIGTIADGETKEFKIPDGQHTVQAKIDWCSSPEVLFSINDLESKNFKLGSFGQTNKLLNSIYLVLAIFVLHFILVETMDFYYTGILLLPSFIFMFYHLTIGRKKYLTLIEN